MDVRKRIEDLRLVPFDILHSIQMDLIHFLNRRDQLENVQKHVRFIYGEQTALIERILGKVNHYSDDAGVSDGRALA